MPREDAEVECQGHDHDLFIAYLFKVIHNITVHRGPKVTQLTDIRHLTGLVILLHVVGQVAGRSHVLLTDTTHQHFVTQVNLFILRSNAIKLVKGNVICKTVLFNINTPTCQYSNNNGSNLLLFT